MHHIIKLAQVRDANNLVFFFFFQAEDGIRDLTVTGVQTCALPIFIWNDCQTQGLAISTMGASFGAYHAANSLFKHPDVIKRCFAMSGVYDLRNFMDGLYDDNFYFNNPIDYLSNMSDPWSYDQIAS